MKKTEPGKKEKNYVWRTCIGLQDEDGLRPSSYLIQTAVRNIEGEITFDETLKLLESCYEKNHESQKENRTEEADKVSARIAKRITEIAFSLSPARLSEYTADCLKGYTVTPAVYVITVFQKRVDIELCQRDFRKCTGVSNRPGI